MSDKQIPERWRSKYSEIMEYALNSKSLMPQLIEELGTAEATIAELRAELKQERDNARIERLETAKEHQRELRDVAAEARHSERTGEEYGTY